MTIYTQNPTGGRSVKIFKTEDRLCSNKEHWYHDSDSEAKFRHCLLYTSPSPRDATLSRMPSSA